MSFRIRAGVVDAPDPSRIRHIPDAYVAWDDAGLLTHVVAWDGQPVDLDARGDVLTPGFVDAHVHFPQTRIVGAASGPLLTWLAKSTFPEEARFADPAHASRVAERFTERLAAAGTTLAFVYASVHPDATDALFRALDARSLRAIAGPVLMDEGGPEALMFPSERALPALRDLAARWHGHDARLQVAAIPRFALSCSAEMMRAAADLALELNLWVSTHFSENLDECAATCGKFDAPDYLSVYEAAGLVHDRCVLAHCIHPSPSEWRRLADAGVVIAHCPDSNDFLGSGGMPLATVDHHGLKVALGTDIAAGRSFHVPRIASSAFDNALRQQHRTAPARWLHTATRGAALALRHPQIGLIEPGFEADLVLHPGPEWAEDADGVVAGLLFDHDAHHPLQTWVRGRSAWRRDR